MQNENHAQHTYTKTKTIYTKNKRIQNQFRKQYKNENHIQQLTPYTKDEHHIQTQYAQNK